jgi:hypothetical protein
VDGAFSFEGRTYRPQLVRCGKAGCKTCTKKGGHGPYWYAFWRVKARTVSRYIGKVLPPGITPPANAIAMPPGWRSHRCSEAALRVIQEAWKLADYGRVFPEHMLLAIVAEDDGLGGRVLRGLGVNESTLRPAMTTVSLASTAASGRRLAGLTGGEARRWHDPAIGTEHLLLAILKLTGLPMVDLLGRQGVTAERAGTAVSALRGLPESGKRCSSCRKPLRAAWQFCPHCGRERAHPDVAVISRAETRPAF